MSSRRRLLSAGLGLALLAPLATPGASQAAVLSGADQGAARQYLAQSQGADGGIELAGMPGFETPDVIMAVAATSQTGSQWNGSASHSALSAFPHGSPLDYIDDLVDGAEEPDSEAAAAQAAKLITLVTGPLGLSSREFDPSEDSASGPVDLRARMDRFRNADGSYDFGPLFNGTLYAALALDAEDDPVPAALVAQIVAAQRSDGSWNYAGDHDADTAGEVDTTSLALMALAAAGRGVSDPAVNAGGAYLAGQQQASGAWAAFGADDPNATAMATMALSALRVDVTTASWVARFGATPRAAYTSPYTWLASQQGSSGRFVSPNDDYGVNSFATSQALQALSRQWHLRHEHAALVDVLLDRLAHDTPRARTVAVDALGPNVAIQAARTRAANATVMSQDGRERAVEELFLTAFGRALDPSGRAYWSNELRGASRAEVLVRITGSPEFYIRAGGNTEAFVDAAYQAVLGRAPDAGGRQFWVSRIDGGSSVQIVALDLVSSLEYRQNQVDAAYTQILDRRSDREGRAFWAERLRTTRVEGIMAGLGGSAEFFNRHA